MIAYTRFEYSSKGIIYSKIPDEFSHQIIYHFSKKFPLFYVMIEHKGKTFALKMGQGLKIFNDSVDEVLKIYEKKLPVLFDLTRDADELWSNFYDSQYIRQRKNIKLFHHFIPKKLKKLKILSKEFESINENKRINF